MCHRLPKLSVPIRRSVLNCLNERRARVGAALRQVDGLHDRSQHTDHRPSGLKPLTNGVSAPVAGSITVTMPVSLHVPLRVGGVRPFTSN